MAGLAKVSRKASRTTKGVKDGGVQKKSKKPVSKRDQMANIGARQAIANGDLATAEIELKKQKDLRTIYVRFESPDSQPTNEEEIRALCPSAVFVRVPRMGSKKEVPRAIKFCYLEFESEAGAEQAKEELTKSGEKYFVDFVGEKSRNVKFTSKEGAAKLKPFNPLRLFVTGLPDGMTESKLRLLFPKCSDAIVKTKGSNVGFVTFWSPGEAKSAFDACQKISTSETVPGLPKLTVVYARMTKRQAPAKFEARKQRKLDRLEGKSVNVNTENANESSESMEETVKSEPEDAEEIKIEEEAAESGDGNVESDDEDVENDKDSEDDENEVEAEDE